MINLSKIFFLFFIAAFLSSNTCSRQEMDIEKIKDIYWVHSYEEDSGNITVYRPQSFDFPPSRGREGFEFKDGGLFKKYVIAPADGINTINGRWRKTEEENVFFIQLNDDSEYDYPVPPDYKLQIYSFDESEKRLSVVNER
ncbi:hypothetical protein BH23BAC1_BH23BAC1_14220 [soil metagenome]